MPVLRWYRARNHGTTRVHLVIIAWLFVIFTMALTMRSTLAGIALFASLGAAPVAAYLAISIRRSRRRREQRNGADAQ